MNIFKKTIFLSFASILVISHAVCMKDEDDKKRPISPSISPNKNDDKIKKLKTSSSDISLDESSEELISKPILTLDENYKPQSIQTIAKYFLFKEAKNFINISEEQRIDRLKLQKMLHYAQSYFYAFYGERLFAEDMIVYYHGCYNDSLKEWGVYKNTSTNMSPFINDKNVENFIELFSPEKLNIPSEANKIIDITYELFSKNSGIELRDKNHKEELYIRLWENGLGKGKAIPLEDLKFYRQPSELSDFQKIMIVNSIKNEKTENLNINFDWIMQTSNIKESFSKLKNIQEYIEHIKDKPKMLLEQWPGQSYSEVVLSTLLFPQNLRVGDELLMPLLFRKNTPIILAFLSKLHNPEAKYYFCDFLDFLFSDSEEKKHKKKYKSIYKFKNKLREEINEQFIKISQQEKDDFYKGMSLLYLNKKIEALKIFKENCKLDIPNPWCLYQGAILEKESDNKKEFWEKAEELLNKETAYSPEEKHVLKRIYLDKGRYTTSSEESLKAYIRGGELELPSAYLSIGRILKEELGKDLKNLGEFKNLSKKCKLEESWQFLEEAGNKGILTAYEFAAEHYIKQGNMEEAKRLYLLQGEKGDSEGYFNLARLYEDEDRIEEAVNFYKKSGFLTSGVEQAARLLKKENDSNAQKEKFVQELKLLLEEIDEE